MEFYLWMDGWMYLLFFKYRSIACGWTCMWSWSWAYEVILSKGHNNLTKLNEKTSCICGKAFQTCNSYGFGWELHITEELYFIFVFLKRWWGLGPIFWEVKVRSTGGELDIDDSASNQHDSNPATATPLLRWLSTKHNLIDLAKKAFPASESKNTSKKG